MKVETKYNIGDYIQYLNRYGDIQIAQVSAIHITDAGISYGLAEASPTVPEHRIKASLSIDAYNPDFSDGKE